MVDDAENTQACRVDEQDAGSDPEHSTSAGRQYDSGGGSYQSNSCRSCKANLPAGIDVSILTDRTTTIRASVEDVQFSLMLTIALVVMAIFLFLRNLRATVIPSVAVPLSLVGTFGVMYLLGFSLNNLTLMALTISTGFVVDDAIVMIENVFRYLEQGETPLNAALKGARQIGFTIISLTVSLIAVLIPLLFMGDIVGRLFREFAVTLGVTILLSALISLTLTPMMCSRLLKQKAEQKPGRLYEASERVFQRVIEFYARTLQWVLKRQKATLLVAAATLVLTVSLPDCPQGTFPGAGYRDHSGDFRSLAKYFLHRDGRAATGFSGCRSEGSGRRKFVVVHRHRWDQHDAQQRAHAH